MLFYCILILLLSGGSQCREITRSVPGNSWDLPFIRVALAPEENSDIDLPTKHAMSSNQIIDNKIKSFNSYENIVKLLMEVKLSKI